MNTNASPSQRSRFAYALLAVLFFASVGFTVRKALIGTNEETIYLVIDPTLSEESLKRIASRLKDKQIDLTYRQADFRSDRLRAIDVTIDVSIPGTPKTSYSLSEKGDTGTFQPLIFYYESGGEQIGFVKGVPAELSAKGKRIVGNNLIGLFIEGKGNREIIGSWRSN